MGQPGVVVVEKKLRKDKRTYTPQTLVNKLAMATLQGQGMGLRKSPYLSDVSADDKRLFQKIVGLSVEEFNQRLNKKLELLTDRIVDRMLDTVEDTPLNSLGFNLSVAIDKRQRLMSANAAGSANVNIQVNNYGQMSKEDILAKLMGKPVAGAIDAASQSAIEIPNDASGDEPDSIASPDSAPDEQARRVPS
jgi:hypothetical protein